MAGLYIHIPFCARRCLYCDFFSTTLLARRGEYVEALLKEIKERRDEAGEPIRTIYIGGGTPSQLEAKEIRRIINTSSPALSQGEEVMEEITMEVNPADVNEEYLQEIREAGVNRLSMGVQSFQDELLRLIGRRHNAEEAVRAVKTAQRAGFENISIDLMYALPTQTTAMWEADVEKALELGVQHISSYGLMYEEGTRLTQMLEAGEIEAVDEDTENEMYDYLCGRLERAGFVHYEVSNFALPGMEAKHNSRYWDGTPYVGVGAGAHSYIRNVRSWNPENTETYIRGTENGDLVRESESLTDKDLYNERIMLGLRTNRGVPDTLLTGQNRAVLESLKEKGLLRETEDKRIVATQQGLHVLNRIIEDLMI